MKIQIHQVLISLLIGLALGFFLQKNLPCHRDWKGPHHMKKHMISKLDRELHLTADQKSKVEMIFETSRPKMKALQDEMRPKFKVLHQETQAEIRLLLNPEQQQKFDAMNARFEARFEKREKEMEENKG